MKEIDIHNRVSPRPKADKKRKSDTFQSINVNYDRRELVLNAFKKGIFPLKTSQGKEIKILTPKQILQKLPIALSQVKAGNQKIY